MLGQHQKYLNLSLKVFLPLPSSPKQKSPVFFLAWNLVFLAKPTSKSNIFTTFACVYVTMQSSDEDRGCGTSVYSVFFKLIILHGYSIFLLYTPYAFLFYTVNIKKKYLKAKFITTTGWNYCQLSKTMV